MYGGGTGREECIPGSVPRVYRGGGVYPGSLPCSIEEVVYSLGSPSLLTSVVYSLGSPSLLTSG